MPVLLVDSAVATRQLRTRYALVMVIRSFFVGGFAISGGGAAERRSSCCSRAECLSSSRGYYRATAKREHSRKVHRYR